MLLDDLLITRSTTGRKKNSRCRMPIYTRSTVLLIVCHTLNYVQRMLYCHCHSHKIKKANLQYKTRQNNIQLPQHEILYFYNHHRICTCCCFRTMYYPYFCWGKIIFVVILIVIIINSIVLLYYVPWYIKRQAAYISFESFEHNRK